MRVSVWDDPTAFDDAQQQLGSTGEITGVGDRAFSSTLSSIYAVADGHTLFIQFADLDRDDAGNLAVTTAIAPPLAVSRLGDGSAGQAEDPLAEDVAHHVRRAAHDRVAGGVDDAAGRLVPQRGLGAERARR